MQQDTLFGEMERPLTQNLYVYCLNNGVNLRDPSGNYSVPLSIEMAGPKAVEDYLIGTGQKKKSKTDTLNDQKKKAESMGVTGSTLAGIQAEIDKIESNSNKPNGGGTGSGNSGSGNNGNNLTPSSGGNSSGGGGSSSGGSNYPTGTGNPNTGGNDKPELTEWEKRLYELYKNGQLGLMEREYFQKNILDKALKADFYDKYYFEELVVGTNTSGGCVNAEHRGTLSYDTQKFIYDLSKKSGVDYYLVLATILHESGCNPNANINNPGAAAGLMQIMPNLWSAYVNPDYKNGYESDFKSLYESAKKQGADFSNIYDPKANVTVGTAMYSVWMNRYNFGDDMSQVVNHYGEGGNGPLSPSTYEILYYRDTLAGSKDKLTWYINDLYTVDGKRIK